MAKNTICVWYDKDAEAAARFYAATFPDSAVGAGLPPAYDPASTAPIGSGDLGQGGCRLQVDGTAGLPSAPEMPCAPRQLRLVPNCGSRAQ